MISTLRRLGGTLFYVPDNALGDGAPNLLSAPEFAGGLADAPLRGGLVTLSSMAGYDNAVAFGHNGAAISYAYKQIAATQGLTYVLSVIVQMDDGNAPTFGSGDAANAANTFSLVLLSDAINPLSNAVESLGGGLFRVSTSRLMPDSVGASNWGVVKYSTNNSRTFKVTGYKLEQGSVATAYTPQSVLRQRGVYVDNVGTTPVTAVADLIGKVLDKTGTNHATQSAVASKPSLQRVNGRNVISFDGSNDFLQTSITTGNEGWVCAGVTMGGASGANETVFASGAGSATQKGVWLLRNSTASALRMGVGNGTALAMAYATTLPLLNVPRVVEGGWDASTVFAGVDGTINSTAKTGDVTAPGTALVGAFLGGILPLQGPMHAIAYAPVLPSAADRATIRNGIAALQGRTL